LIISSTLSSRPAAASRHVVGVVPLDGRARSPPSVLAVPRRLRLSTDCLINPSPARAPALPSRLPPRGPRCLGREHVRGPFGLRRLAALRARRRGLLARELVRPAQRVRRFTAYAGQLAPPLR